MKFVGRCVKIIMLSLSCRQQNVGKSTDLNAKRKTEYTQTNSSDNRLVTEPVVKYDKNSIHIKK